MKSAILLVCRLKSIRLPLKAIKLIRGKPMIVHILDRLKLSKMPEDIIICTSTVDQDDKLEEIALEQGVKCYRGDPDDVLLRLTKAAEYYNVETVINCTGDNPFVDPLYIDKLCQYHVQKGNDFSKINGLPWGTFSYAISNSAMRKACEIKDTSDTEVWHGYFMESGYFKWGTLEVDDTALQAPNLRLTVDTPEDFEMVSRIFNELYEPGKIFSLKEIVKLCEENSEIPAINKLVKQKPVIPISLKDISNS